MKRYRLTIGECELAGLSFALGAAEVGEVSAREKNFLDLAIAPKKDDVVACRYEIAADHDPLGSRLCGLLAPQVRRSEGVTYTPTHLTRAMLSIAAEMGTPARVIDPASGSARLLLAAGKRFQSATLVGYETDALAALVARANIAACGLTGRTTITVADYRSAEIPPCDGPTLFLANPPYTRHHEIPKSWKRWYAEQCQIAGIDASLRAGLHAYFFLATALKASPADFGVFLTSATWLRADYGMAVRQLLLNGLGANTLALFDVAHEPFEDAKTNAVITAFKKADTPSSIRVRRFVLGRKGATLSRGRLVRRERLAELSDWGNVFSQRRVANTKDFTRLGEFCDVHRGQATGLNRVWIAGDHSKYLPKSVLFPTITRGKEIYSARGRIASTRMLRDVIDLPSTLDDCDSETKKAILRFIRFAGRCNAHKAYLARHRRPWWRVRLLRPAPIVVTYMSRRAPAFAYNVARARILNIAHGVFPRERLSSSAVKRLVSYLANTVKLTDGRSYASGLTKFEPSDVSRIWVPRPEALEAAMLSRSDG